MSQSQQGKGTVSSFGEVNICRRNYVCWDFSICCSFVTVTQVLSSGE